MPHPVGQLHLLAQQQAHHVFARHPKGIGQAQRHGAVKHGGFPLDKALVVQAQGQGAKAQHQHQGDFLHDFQPLLRLVDVGGLQHGSRHQHGGGGVNVIELVGPKKQKNGEKVDKWLHAGVKCSEAEFMQ